VAEQTPSQTPSQDQTPPITFLRSSIPNTTQQIRTPQIEGDVEIEPNDVGGLTTSTRVQRVWALLFGWSGSDLRKLNCDRNGNLMTRRVDWSRYSTVSAEVSSTSGPTIIDLGRQVDHVYGWFIDDIPLLEFSLAITNFGHTRMAVATAADGGTTSNQSIIDLWITTRYVRVTANGFGPGTTQGYLYGAYK
jgi:hypothetical protein